MFKTLALAGLTATALVLAGCGEAQAPVPASIPAPVPAPVVAPEPAPAPVLAPVETSEESTESTSSGDTGQDQNITEQSETGYSESDGVVDGPGYLDPDAYHGGASSGDTQREWLIEQGLLTE